MVELLENKQDAKDSLDSLFRKVREMLIPTDNKEEVIESESFTQWMDCITLQYFASIDDDNSEGEQLLEFKRAMEMTDFLVTGLKDPEEIESYFREILALLFTFMDCNPVVSIDLLYKKLDCIWDRIVITVESKWAKALPQ